MSDEAKTETSRSANDGVEVVTAEASVLISDAVASSSNDCIAEKSTAADEEKEGIVLAADNGVEEDGDSTAMRWCSWCYTRTEHESIKRNWVSRNLCQCLHCYCLTVKCVACKEMARSRPNGTSDKLCAKCSKVISSWGTFPTSDLLEGYCSWCFDKCQQKIVERNMVGRNILQCQGCGQQTTLCLRCHCAFSRSHSSSNDISCSLCSNLIESWEDAKSSAKVILASRWCSWCFEPTTHRLEQKNKVKKDTYRCEGCQASTIKCQTTNCEAMARGGVGWFDYTCSLCEGKVKTWEELQKIKNQYASQFEDQERIVAELSRSSRYRKMAQSAGLLRPFLLIVSMTPATRCQLAACLGWTLLVDPCSGDPHAEAWEILANKKKGICAYSKEIRENINPFSSLPSWYAILRRLLVEVFQKADAADLGSRDALNASLSGVSDEIFIIETEFLRRIAQLQWRSMTDLQRQEIIDERNSEKGMQAAVLLQNAGVKDETVISLGVQVAKQMSGVGPFSALVFTLTVIGEAGYPLVAALASNLGLVLTPLAILGWVVLATRGIKYALGPSYGRVFPVVVRLLQQRLLLALKGLPLEDFCLLDEE